MGLATGGVAAQTLDERLDEGAFLSGLVEFGLVEVLEHYIATHPAGDDIQAAGYAIATERLRIGSAAAASSIERERAAEHIIAIRQGLIEGRPRHPSRAAWLADQAEDLYFELLPVDASGMTTLFGLPSHAQRTRAQRVARDMNELTRLAEAEIERVIMRIEAAPDYRENELLQARRRGLARDERDLRVPFLRGIAVFLHAELSQTAENRRSESYKAAIDLLLPLAESAQGTVGSRAHLYCGLASARLGRYDEAERLFRELATSEDASAMDVFAARMGGVLNRFVDRGPQAALNGLESVAPKYRGSEQVFYRVLITDQRFLLLRRLALEKEEGGTREGMQRAIECYIGLLDEETGVPRDVMRTIVFGKLALAVKDDAPLEGLPAIVAVARAEQLRRRERDRSEAIEIYQAVLARKDTEPQDRAAALLGLGKTLYASGRKVAAMQRLVSMAADYPDDPQAQAAVELAASIGSEVFQADPGDDDVRSGLRTAVSIALERYPHSADANRWRFVGGRLAMSEGRFDSAAAMFDEIPPDAEEWLDARFMRVSAMKAMAEAVAEGTDERKLRNEEVLGTAERTASLIDAAIPEADAARAADLIYYRAHLNAFCAKVLVELGRADAALGAIQIGLGDAALDEESLAVTLRARIETLRALGDSAQVRREAERLFKVAPDQAGEIICSMLEPMLREIECLIEGEQEDEARRRAADEVVPLAELIEKHFNRPQQDPNRAAGSLRRAADAYRLGGSYHDGLRLYDRLLKYQPDAVEVLFGRAECLFGLGGEDLAEAIAIYKRIAAGGIEVGEDCYWRSQLRMLQILDMVQKNTDQIAPRIQRLRLQDPELGGERYRRMFQRLEAKYG